jgi:hypothetical protein
VASLGGKSKKIHLFKNSVHTSQGTHSVSITTTNRLILFRENRTEHINALCGQNGKFFNVEAGGTYKY